MRYILSALSVVGLLSVTTPTAAQNKPTEFWTEYAAAAGTPVVVPTAQASDQTALRPGKPAATAPLSTLVPANLAGSKAAPTTSARRKRR